MGVLLYCFLLNFGIEISSQSAGISLADKILLAAYWVKVASGNS